MSNLFDLKLPATVDIESPDVRDDAPGYYAALYVVFSRYSDLHRAGLIGPAWPTGTGVELAPADSVHGCCRHRAQYLPMWRVARYVRELWEWRNAPVSAPGLAGWARGEEESFLEMARR